jgi:hypothetical protein
VTQIQVASRAQSTWLTHSFNPNSDAVAHPSLARVTKIAFHLQLQPSFPFKKILHYIVVTLIIKTNMASNEELLRSLGDETKLWSPSKKEEASPVDVLANKVVCVYRV